MEAPVGSSVVLVSRDPRLADDVRRLCAVAGAPLRVCRDPSDLASVWRAVAVVLVDADLADAVASAGLPRRPGVLVLAARPDELGPWRAATWLGAEQVLTPGTDDHALVDRVAKAADGDAAPGRLIAVVPGCPGAGASTFAVALGVQAASSEPVTLVDLDAYGGGIDLPLGLEHAPGARWPELMAARGVVRRDAFEAAVLRRGALALVPAGRDAVQPLPSAAVDSVLDAARRSTPLVVADLPPTPTDATAVALHAADVVLLVVTAQVRAVAAAGAALQLIASSGRLPILVLRTQRRDRLAPRDVAAALGVDVAATVGTELEVAAAADYGELGTVAGSGRLGAAAADLLHDLGLRRAG